MHAQTFGHVMAQLRGNELTDEQAEELYKFASLRIKHIACHGCKRLTPKADTIGSSTGHRYCSGCVEFARRAAITEDLTKGGD